MAKTIISQMPSPDNGRGIVAKIYGNNAARVWPISVVENHQFANCIAVEAARNTDMEIVCERNIMIRGIHSERRKPQHNRATGENR